VVPPLLLAFLDIFAGLVVIFWAYRWGEVEGGYILSYWLFVFATPLFAAFLLWILCMEFIEVRSPLTTVVRHRYFDAAGGHILGFTATMAFLVLFTFFAVLDTRDD
jgi:hypothetical protein